VNWQIKEYMRGKGARVKTELKKVVQIAEEAGYRAYLPIETLATAGEKYDPQARTRHLRAELRAAMRTTECRLTNGRTRPVPRCWLPTVPHRQRRPRRFDRATGSGG